jgi:hypothetical protein
VDTKVTIDARDYAKVYDELRQLANGKELIRELARALHEAAGPAVEDERALWAGISKRIPETVRARVRPGPKPKIMIFAGGTPSTEHAKVLEGYDSGAPYRHPVFARTHFGHFDLGASQTGRSEWTWVAQSPPAQIVPQVIERNADRIAEHVADKVEAFVDEHLR